MNKKSTLLSLLRVAQDDVIFKFLSNDFTQERWQTAGHRNAFEQMKKHNYRMTAELTAAVLVRGMESDERRGVGHGAELAIAFFLVAGGLREAVDCAVQGLQDLQLALFIARLVEGGTVGRGAAVLRCKGVIMAPTLTSLQWGLACG